MFENLMMTVVCEILDVSKFVNVGVTNIAFNANRHYLSGVCDIDGNEVCLPKIYQSDNLRKIIISWLIKYMPDK